MQKHFWRDWEVTLTHIQSMGNLTVAEQQIVEIAKAISTNAKIIIMDEAYGGLSKREM